MKVALVSEEFPPYIIGGTGIFCYDLAQWLSKKGIFTTVYSGRSRQLTKEKVNDYLEVVRLPCLDFPPRFLWFQLENFSNISKQLKDCSVIHSITPEVSPICAYLKRRLSRPLVTSFHGVTKYEMKSFLNVPVSEWTVKEFGFHVFGLPFYWTSNRLSVASSDHVISCSFAVLNELKSTYENLDISRSSVIYNGIDLDEIDQIERSYKTSKNPNDLTLIYYGRLNWLKGVTYVVEAFKLLIRSYPNLTLKIFGDGPLRRSLMMVAASPDLKNKVHILGQISRSELLREIMRADVVVLPSMREAQPLSVLEAMACKKPVVVFDLPFASEYIKSSVNGMTARPGDPKDLADKISMLLSDRNLRSRIGHEAYEHIKYNHNWSDLIDRYIDVYEKVSWAS